MDALRNNVRQILGLCTICLGLTACADRTLMEPTISTTRNVVEMHLGVSRDLVTIQEGQRASVRTERSATSPADVSWSSADESIAKVDENGNILGITVGTTMLTVISRNGSADVVVTVLPANTEDAANAQPTL